MTQLGRNFEIAEGGTMTDEEHETWVTEGELSITLEGGWASPVLELDGQPLAELISEHFGVAGGGYPKNIGPVKVTICQL